ncbi:MAG: divalent-cation tolerance protein CutA [Acidobacteriota bacterium]
MIQPTRTAKMLIVSTTTSDEDEAERLAGSIIEGRLAACVQIVPRITSVYFWGGELTRGSECLLLIKTTSEKFSDVERFIIENHSYAVPEILSVRVDRVSEAYADWVNEYLGKQ